MASSAAQARPILDLQRTSDAASRFISGFYTSSIVLLALYVVLRQHYMARGGSTHSKLAGPDELCYWEHRMLSCFILAAFVKLFRNDTMDAYLADVLTLAKLVMCSMLVLADWRLAVYFALAWLGAWMLFRQPMYNGAAKVVELTPAALEDITAAGRSDTVWLVEAYASWSGSSIEFQPMFAELSLAFSCEALRFARIDITRWPRVCDELDVSASDAAPTLLLYEDGVETARVSLNASMFGKPRVRHSAIVKALELDVRLLKCRSHKHAEASMPHIAPAQLAPQQQQQLQQQMTDSAHAPRRRAVATANQ